MSFNGKDKRLTGLEDVDTALPDNVDILLFPFRDKEFTGAIVRSSVRCRELRKRLVEALPEVEVEFKVNFDSDARRTGTSSSSSSMTFPSGGARRVIVLPFPNSFTFALLLIPLSPAIGLVGGLGLEGPETAGTASDLGYVRDETCWACFGLGFIFPFCAASTAAVDASALVFFHV